MDRTVETYSSGQKMKLVFARSLISDAPILLLDEPTNTLDVQGARKLRKIVNELNKEEGKTVVYCTHQMFEADELCDRVAIIDYGNIVEIGSPNELKASLEQEDLIDIEGAFGVGIESEIASIAGVKTAFLRQLNGNGASEGENILSVTCKGSSRKVLPKIMDTLQTDGSSISYIKPRDVSLEDVFLHHTGRTLSEDTAVT